MVFRGAAEKGSSSEIVNIFALYQEMFQSEQAAQYVFTLTKDHTELLHQLEKKKVIVTAEWTHVRLR